MNTTQKPSPCCTSKLILRILNFLRGTTHQCFYWMASLKPLPARNPGVFDAAM